MGAKKLRWSGTKISSFSDGRACLVVQFLDQEGNLLEWVPAWTQVQALFERATNTEVVNKPDSEWLGSFAKTAGDVFKTFDPLKEAYKINGTLFRIQDGNLVVLTLRDEVEQVIPPAFQVSEEFLEDWLDQNVTALVINGYAVRVWRATYDGMRIEYPQPDEAEIPFE